MDRDALSDADSQALETWLAGDSRRLGALMRARAILVQGEVSQAARVGAPSRGSPSAPSRRGLMRMGAGLAAAAGVGGLVYGLTPSRSFATERGEIRQIPLADGVNITLNTLTEMRVRPVDQAGDVRLVSGEVLVDVARDAAKACVLRIDDFSVRGADALFFVSRLPDQASRLTVHRGSVVLVKPDGTATMALSEGQRLTLGAGAGAQASLTTLTFDEMTRELSWREGRLAFHDETLGSAVDAFARYSRQPIVLRRADLNDQTITGLFASNDPAGFAQAVGAAFNAPVRAEAGRIIIG